MVIVLISILAVYAAPQFNRGTHEVAESAGEVIEAIRYTQVLAMEHSGLGDSEPDGNDDYYCFRITGSSYAVSISDSDSDNTAVNDPVQGGNYRESWSGGVGLTPSVNDICFTARGVPVDTSGSELGADVTITVSRSGANQVVTVEQLTGYAH